MLTDVPPYRRKLNISLIGCAEGLTSTMTAKLLFMMMRGQSTYELDGANINQYILCVNTIL